MEMQCTINSFWTSHDSNKIFLLWVLNSQLAMVCYNVLYLFRLFVRVNYWQLTSYEYHNVSFSPTFTSIHLRSWKMNTEAQKHTSIVLYFWTNTCQNYSYCQMYIYFNYHTDLPMLHCILVQVWHLTHSKIQGSIEFQRK